MTRGQERAGAVFSLLFGVLGVWFSKRVSTDVIFGLIGLCAFLLFITPSVLRWWGNRASRRRVAQRKREKRETPWRHYSRPVPGHHGMWEVGIERRTDDGELLSPPTPADAVLHEDAHFDITMAEVEAQTKASRYNDNRVGM